MMCEGVCVWGARAGGGQACLKRRLVAAGDVGAGQEIDAGEIDAGAGNPWCLS